MRVIRIIFLVLMAACMIYAVSIYMVRSGTYSFVLWLAGAAFFGLAYYLGGNGRWLRVPVALRGACCVLIALSLSLMLVCMGAMLSHFGDRGERGLDYIVVLGAQMRSGKPSTIYRYRLDAACQYLMENPDTICIVSGGQGNNENISEGEGGKEYLVSEGIAGERIIAETKAMTTVENIANSLALMDKTSDADNIRIGIVTNNFHVFRGIHLSRKLTSDEVCGIAAYTLPWYLPNSMVRECFGILKDIPRMK